MTDPSNKLKTLAGKVVQPFVGRKIFQNIFEALLQLSFIGMNIGGGETPNTSGEKYVLHYIKKNIKSKETIIVFDVGANTGDHSLLVEKVFGKNTYLHVFEPSEKTFSKLQKNLRKYKNIVLNRFALGEHSQNTFLYKDRELSPLASVYNRDLSYINKNLKMKSKENIKIATLDSYCTKKDIKHIHFLKLDTEGNELNILKGSTKMLTSKSIDYIQFEFSSCNLDARTYFRDYYNLLNPDFKIYRILRDGLQPIKSYRPLNEAFYTANYLAIVRGYS